MKSIKKNSHLQSLAPGVAYSECIKQKLRKSVPLNEMTKQMAHRASASWVKKKHFASSPWGQMKAEAGPSCHECLGPPQVQDTQAIMFFKAAAVLSPGTCGHCLL